MSNLPIPFPSIFCTNVTLSISALEGWNPNAPVRQLERAKLERYNQPTSGSIFFYHHEGSDHTHLTATLRGAYLDVYKSSSYRDNTFSTNIRRPVSMRFRQGHRGDQSSSLVCAPGLLQVLQATLPSTVAWFRTLLGDIKTQ